MINIYKRKKHSYIKSILTLVFLILLSISQITSPAYADNSDKNEDGLNQSIEDVLAAVDVSGIDELLVGLTDEERAIFGSSDASGKIKDIVRGKVDLDYGSFFSYFLRIIGLSASKVMPFVLTLIGINVAAAFMNAIKGNLASSSVENIISFAFTAIIIILVSAQIAVIISNVTKTITSIQKQMNIVFPIILTLMTAIGSVSSVSVYRPAVAILSSGIVELTVGIILPLVILSMVFCIVGSVSGTVKLGKLSDFFSGCIKSLMSGAFFIFLAFLSIQGITASVYDSVSIRATKFAINNYVPIIGGYLSEGMNLVMAGSVLIKNAVGMCAVLILIITVVPLLLQIVVFRLSLSFVGAVIEPLGNDALGKMFVGLSKCLKTLVAVLFGVFFLYFIFLVLVICTGNLIL